VVSLQGNTTTTPESNYTVIAANGADRLLGSAALAGAVAAVVVVGAM
jgi:hypothetical protein